MNKLEENSRSSVQSKMDILAVERRKHPRVSVDLPLGYSRMDNKEIGGGIVANASGGGLLVCLPKRMEIGAVLRIEILYVKDLQLDLIEAIAKVVWSNLATRGNIGEHHYGLEFQYIDEKDYNRLSALLKGLEVNN